MIATSVLDLKVINLWAGPGAGKSTAAAGLFNLMKSRSMRVELVTEYAKDLTYEKNYGTLQNQLLVVAQQDNRLRRLVGQVDYAITDSPLPLSEAYMTPEYEDWLPDAIGGAYDRYNNFDFWVNRKKPYATYGRSQTEHQALALDVSLKDVFRRYAGGLHTPRVWEIDGDHNAPYVILEKMEINA